MNSAIAMITNHAHARTNPPPPTLGEPKSKKIGFVAPMLIFPSAKISKTINMLCNLTWYNQCHNKIKMKWYKY